MGGKRESIKGEILKPNYSANRKRKEEARRKKQEEKRNKHLNKSKITPNPELESGPVEVPPPII